MKKEQLEHIIRASAAITNEYNFIIIGSQSILGIDNPPDACLMSMEADIYPLNNEALSDLIDGSIGEESPFHDLFKYYAQGVDSSTATLPSGWETRLNKIQSKNTLGYAGYCISPADLFLSKCVAWREKDVKFNKELLKNKIVNVDTILKLVKDLPIDLIRQTKIIANINRINSEVNLDLDENQKEGQTVTSIKF